MSRRRPSTPQYLPRAEQFILAKGLWEEWVAFRQLKEEACVLLARTSRLHLTNPERLKAEEIAAAAGVQREWFHRTTREREKGVVRVANPRGCKDCASAHRDVRPNASPGAIYEHNCGHGCHRVAARAS